MENLSGQGEQKKRLWTAEEDQKLRRYMEGIKEHEQKRRGFWGQVPKLAGLNRSGKSCWLRWTEHLERSGMKKGKFSIDEDKKVKELRANKFQGKNKWSDIAKELPGRTPNEVKNHWYNGLKKPFTPTQTSAVQAATQGFIDNITPNPPEPHLGNGFPLPSQGPNSFNDTTMEYQFGPSRSILNYPQIHKNHPVDVSSIPAEPHGLGLNSTGPAQVSVDSNYHGFDSSSTIPGQSGIYREELITQDEKACLESTEQFLMNDYYYNHSDDEVDSWMKALGSCLNL